MNKIHSFNSDDANSYGVEEALILQLMRNWLDLHKAQNKHKHKYLKPAAEHYNRTFYWTFFTASQLKKILPYLGSVNGIYEKLQVLESKGVIISETLSENKGNRAKSYTIPLEYPCLTSEKPSSGTSYSNTHNAPKSYNNTPNIPANYSNQQITHSNPQTLPLKSLPPENYNLEISNDPLPETISKSYLDIAKMMGLSKNLDIIYQQFLGHIQSKNCANLEYSRKRGMWRNYLATAKLNETVYQARQKQKPDRLDTHDTSWANDLNEKDLF